MCCILWLVQIYMLFVMKKFIPQFYSDGTLNPNGVRFGSAEIYQIGKSLKLCVLSPLPVLVLVKVPCFFVLYCILAEDLKYRMLLVDSFFFALKIYLGHIIWMELHFLWDIKYCWSMKDIYLGHIIWMELHFLWDIKYCWFVKD